MLRATGEAGHPPPFLFGRQPGGPPAAASAAAGEQPLPARRRSRSSSFGASWRGVYGRRATNRDRRLVDRSGSPGYNQRLSERRASAVATALEGLGVPRSQMIVSGRGENDNRVPTADGVREPQNRRFEIVFP